MVKVISNDFVCTAISQDYFVVNGDKHDGFSIVLAPIRNDPVEGERVVVSDTHERLHFFAYGPTDAFQVGRRYKISFEEVR